MSGVRLAIVGSTDFPDEDCWAEAGRLARVAIENLQPEVVISGGAPGMDTLSQDVAATHGYTEPNGRFVVHRPKVKAWAEPGGFRDRNLLIAQDCTHLLCIRSRLSTTYGSGWTADQAEKLGKDVRRYLLPAQTGDSARAEVAPR